MKLNLFLKVLNYCEILKSEKYVRVFANKLYIKICIMHTCVCKFTLYICILYTVKNL